MGFWDVIMKSKTKDIDQVITWTNLQQDINGIIEVLR
jgi:hypothetical protein